MATTSNSAALTTGARRAMEDARGSLAGANQFADATDVQVLGWRRKDEARAARRIVSAVRQITQRNDMGNPTTTSFELELEIDALLREIVAYVNEHKAEHMAEILRGNKYMAPKLKGFFGWKV